MKKTIQILLVLLFALDGAKTAQAQPGGGDPVQRAEKQTELMAEKLALSEAQTAKVREINLRFAQKTKALREANPDADRAAMREKMQALRTEQDAELKTMLTDEQWAAWEKIRAEQRAKWGGDRPGGG